MLFRSPIVEAPLSVQNVQDGEEEMEGGIGGREEEEEMPPQREFSAGERSVVVVENGGLRLIVPRPDLIGDQYFECVAEEEEEGYQEEEDLGPWGDGTKVQMINGGFGELSGCQPVMFGGLSVEVELRELDLANQSNDASTEEEREESLGEEEEHVVASAPPGADM